MSIGVGAHTMLRASRACSGTNKRGPRKIDVVTQSDSVGLSNHGCMIALSERTRSRAPGSLTDCDRARPMGGVASLVGITGGVISGLSKPSQNRWLEPPWRLRHAEG